MTDSWRSPLKDVLELSDVELRRWARITEDLKSGMPWRSGHRIGPLGMPDWPASLPSPAGAAAGSVLMATDQTGQNLIWNPRIELGPFDIGGDSHISEYGVSIAAQGISQKVAGMLLPGVFRNCALGGSYHAAHDAGNGALGDGGWAHIANEYNRQEQSAQRFATTINTTLVGGSSTSTTVTSLPAQGTAANPNPLAPIAGEWLILGSALSPANTEIIQVANNWNGASPITFQTAVVNAHVSGDPIYHACRNEGNLAKSAVVFLCAEGANDVGYSGPGAPPAGLTGSWQSGTFGATIGASVGWAPFMQALRFSIAQLRCSVIYADNHPAITYGLNWTSTAATSTASYPPIFTPFNGGNTGNYHNTATNGSTLAFSTGPDFAGGTVDGFFAVPSSGQGAIWDWSVSGATTRAMTANTAGSQFDNRNVLLIPMNNASIVNGFICGTCIRVTGLAPGVNTITFRATTITSLAAFLGIGIEAPIPPLVLCAQTARVAGNLNGTTFNAGPGPYYNRRTKAATGATVSAGAGTVAGSVAFTGGTVALATAGTPSQTLSQVNDTITLDKGNANEETRRIVGWTGSPATACQVDANFVNAHTAAPIQIGLQDADYVGGGQFNTADTQGAISVPGAAGVINKIVSEFDSNVIAVPFDPFINGTPQSAVNALNFYSGDGIHFNDQGSGKIAAGVAQAILTHATSIPIVSSAVVPNKRSFQGVYNDTGLSSASTILPVFVNTWSNVYSSTFTNATSYPRTGFYQDPRSREVEVRGAVIAGTANNTITTLPAGMRPSGVTPIPAWNITAAGVYTPVAVTVDATGALILKSGWVATTSAIVFCGKFFAEA